MIVTDYTNTVRRVTEGAALLPLNFVVESNLVSSFTFYKDGVIMTVTPSPSTLNQPDISWYIVRQTAKPYSTTASREMSGQYNVTACNSFGCVTSNTTTMIVECKSKSYLILAYISSGCFTLSHWSIKNITSYATNENA